MATQRNIGRDILDGIAELKRGQPGRITHLPSVSSVREKTGLSQLKFGGRADPVDGRREKPPRARRSGVTGDSTPPHPALRPTTFSRARIAYYAAVRVF